MKLQDQVIMKIQYTAKKLKLHKVYIAFRKKKGILYFKVKKVYLDQQNIILKI